MKCWVILMILGKTQFLVIQCFCCSVFTVCCFARRFQASTHWHADLFLSLWLPGLLDVFPSLPPFIWTLVTL